MIDPAKLLLVMLVTCSAISAAPAKADDLTRQAQQDLTLLGYDVGPVDGEYGMKTKLAVGKFQQQNGLAVTGEITFPLVIAISKQADALRARNPNLTQEGDLATNLSAQERCLQEKQASAERRARTTKLISAISRSVRKVVGRVAGNEAVRDMDTMSQDAADVAAIAKELGINEADARDCLEQADH